MTKPKPRKPKKTMEPKKSEVGNPPKADLPKEVDYMDRMVALKNYVSYSKLGINLVEIAKEYESICFANLWMEITKEVFWVDVTRPMSIVPYSEKSISRWFYDLSVIGFGPQRWFIEGGKLHSQYSIEVYQKMGMFASAITLNRCLYEKYIAPIPEIYFRLMDKALSEPQVIPKEDLIYENIFKAHTSLTNGGAYLPGGHMVLYRREAKMRPLKELKELLSKSSIYNGMEYGVIHNSWHG